MTKAEATKRKTVGYILRIDWFNTSELDDWSGNYAVFIFTHNKGYGWYVGDSGDSDGRDKTVYFCRDLEILQTASEALFKNCPVSIEAESIEYPFDHLLCTSIKLENKEEFV